MSAYFKIFKKGGGGGGGRLIEELLETVTVLFAVLYMY